MPNRSIRKRQPSPPRSLTQRLESATQSHSLAAIAETDINRERLTRHANHKPSVMAMMIPLGTLPPLWDRIRGISGTWQMVQEDRFDLPMRSPIDLEGDVTDRDPLTILGNDPRVMEDIASDRLIIIALGKIPTELVVEIIDHGSSVCPCRDLINHNDTRLLLRV